MTLRESSANYFRPLAQCVYTRKILETICEHIRWYQSGTAAWFRIERCISLLPSAFLPLPLYLSCSLSIYLSSHLSLSLDICDLVVKLSGWRNKVSKECEDGAFNREYCLWETIALPHPRLDVSSFDVGYPPPPLLLQPDNPRAFVMPWPDLRHHSPSDSPYVRVICMNYNMVARTYGWFVSTCVRYPFTAKFCCGDVKLRAGLVCNRCFAPFPVVSREIKDRCEQQYRKRKALYVFAHCALVRDCLFAEIFFRKLLALKTANSKSFYNL